jgi:hypothetical protein
MGFLDDFEKWVKGEPDVPPTQRFPENPDIGTKATMIVA